MLPRSTVKRSLLHGALRLAPLPVMIVTAASVPAVAQKAKIAPDNTVMGMRLHGTWQDDQYDYIFEPADRGQVRFRQVVRGTGREYAKGTLEPMVGLGAMIGRVRYSPVNSLPYEKEFKAWVADNDKLWMNGHNAGADQKFYVQVPRSPEPAVQAAWAGKWRTSLGMLEIIPDGSNFIGWITHDGDPRKERVAFRADAKAANGAWDSEYDAQGKWLHKPARWGDLRLTLSADGNGFTGTYSTTKPEALGLEERSWTGERVERRPGTSQPQTPAPQPQIPISDPVPAREPEKPTVDLVRLTGKWDAAWGSFEIIGGADGYASAPATVYAELRAPGKPTTGFSVRAVKGQLIGQGLERSWDGLRTFTARLVDDQTLEFVITEGRQFEGRTMLIARRGEATFSSANLAGEWETSLGKLDLRAEGAHLIGLVVPRSGGSEGRKLVAIHHFDDTSRPVTGLAGAWKAAITGVEGAGTVRIDPSPDGRSFTGTYTRTAAGKLVEEGWSGRKAALAETPASTPVPPPASAPTPRPRPTPAPTMPVPQAEAPADDFQPLGKWDVRLDRVENPRDDRLTHIYLTLRNAATRDLLMTEGVWVYLEAGGLERKSGQGLRAEPGYPQLFPSPSPIVRPGKEIRTKFVFERQDQAGPITVTIEEGGKQATYDF